MPGALSDGGSARREGGASLRGAGLFFKGRVRAGGVKLNLKSRSASS